MTKYFEITLRIEILKAAIRYITSTLAMAQHEAKFRLGLYIFNTDVHEVCPLGPPFSAAPSIVRMDVTAIDDDGPNDNYNQTSFAVSTSAGFTR